MGFPTPRHGTRHRHLQQAHGRRPSDIRDGDDTRPCHEVRGQVQLLQYDRRQSGFSRRRQGGDRGLRRGGPAATGDGYGLLSFRRAGEAVDATRPCRHHPRLRDVSGPGNGHGRANEGADLLRPVPPPYDPDRRGRLDNRHIGGARQRCEDPPAARRGARARGHCGTGAGPRPRPGSRASSSAPSDDERGHRPAPVPRDAVPEPGDTQIRVCGPGNASA